MDDDINVTQTSRNISGRYIDQFQIMRRNVKIKNIIRFVSKGLILGAIMLCSVMPVCAKEYTVTAATETYASFGSDSSLTNIMPKSPMVKPGPAVQSYEKTASMFTYYKKANTVLYY